MKIQIATANGRMVGAYANTELAERHRKFHPHGFTITETELIQYGDGTIILDLSGARFEKRPHGWVDAGCNAVLVDESLIGTKYRLL